MDVADRRAMEVEVDDRDAAVKFETLDKSLIEETSFPLKIVVLI